MGGNKLLAKLKDQRGSSWEVTEEARIEEVEMQRAEARVLMASAEQKAKVEKVEGEAEGGDPGGCVGREGEGGGDAAQREAATSRRRWRLAVATVAMGSGDGKTWRWWRRC